MSRNAHFAPWNMNTKAKESSEVWGHHISQSPNTSNKSPGRCIIKQSGNGNTIKTAEQQLKVKKLAKRIGRKRVHQEINAGILTWRTEQSGPEGMERAAFIPDRRRETMTHRCRHNGGRTGEEEERSHGKTNQKASQELIKVAKTNKQTNLWTLPSLFCAFLDLLRRWMPGEADCSS